MKGRYHLAALLVTLLILGLSVRLNDSARDSENPVKPDPSKLRSFLESQYAPEANLLRAALKVYPDNQTTYVANDNLLASRALIALGSPLGEKILENLNANYSGGWNGKVDVLLGRPIGGFHCTETKKLGGGIFQKVRRDV